ncbi:hypothetical protein Poli38472_003583 [Pythium oligandrum]|uniref:TFIIS N-terminal domain-containing protein n=1 Tax=Pythium oligandrum TaxID=41045 RepID=A0A8K1FPP0_PYTOL|nr:hypothetical protein Poli38472_003583 [Pythium oligandrum]|eukprot:TMW65818.1 hypothetical protein Poli38472_003583 [Pythium oligandrum]
MATTSGDVQAMARQIERLVTRPGWQSDAGLASDMMGVLGKLTTVKVDVDLLKSTGIGKMVKKLTKHQDDVVKGYSASLMNKWMTQVGVAGEKPGKPSAANARSASPALPQNGGGSDPNRYESARKKLQEKYAAEKAKREARTVQVLNRPITGKKRSTTISAAPSRSSTVARSKLMAQRRPLGMAGSRAPSTSTSNPLTPPVRRPMPSPPMQRRPASAPLSSNDPEEIHRRRIERLRALAVQQEQDRDGAKNGRPSASGRAPAGQKASASRPNAPAKSVDPRKAMLDRMIPRVCGVSTDTSASGKTKKSADGSKSSGKKAKNVSYSEGQREVIQWLKRLDVDMSDYAQAFFDNGFDSIKLLNEIKPRDLESMVPKAGHQRMIEKALNDLKRKQSTAASSRPRSAQRERDLPRRKPQRDSYFDEDSDDSFVVSDGDEYAPGVITAMLRKGRKRSYSIDSTDSYNMEASYAEIQHEEERSKRIGEYEDYREELRNKNMLKKSKK